jgi:hypothetical protein
VEEIRWDRSEGGWFTHRWDIFGDGQVLALRLRGTAWGEVALRVPGPDGRSMLLVGESLWQSSQLRGGTLRSLWASHLWDRNRMQAAVLQRQLMGLHEAGWHVVVLSDGAGEAVHGMRPPTPLEGN